MFVDKRLPRVFLGKKIEIGLADHLCLILKTELADQRPADRYEPAARVFEVNAVRQVLQQCLQQVLFVFHSGRSLADSTFEVGRSPSQPDDRQNGAGQQHPHEGRQKHQRSPKFRQDLRLCRRRELLRKQPPLFIDKKRPPTQ